MTFKQDRRNSGCKWCSVDSLGTERCGCHPSTGRPGGGMATALLVPPGPPLAPPAPCKPLPGPSKAMPSPPMPLIGPPTALPGTSMLSSHNPSSDPTRGGKVSMVAPCTKAITRYFMHAYSSKTSAGTLKHHHAIHHLKTCAYIVTTSCAV